MKKIAFFTIIILLITSIGCNENRIYQKYHKNFTDYQWHKTKTIEFQPQINDTSINYNIFVAFRYIYGFPEETLKIKIEIISPSGKLQNLNNSLIIRKKREYQGDCAGDYCDLETLILNNHKFTETGTYKFKITSNEQTDPINFVMEIGIIIDKIPIEK